MSAAPGGEVRVLVLPGERGEPGAGARAGVQAGVQAGVGPGGEGGPGPWDWMIPAAAVVEILRPDALIPPPPGGPDWLVGIRAWRGFALPVVWLGGLPAGAPTGRGRLGPGDYLAVCLGAQGDPGLPFFGVASPAPPRLERVVARGLAADPAQMPMALAALRLNGRPTLLADLESVERGLIALGEAAREPGPGRLGKPPSGVADLPG